MESNLIVLDTHIWLWWLLQDTKKLSQSRLEKIEQSKQVAISAISCFEVAWLNHHKRISLPFNIEEWFDMALEGSGITLLSIESCQSSNPTNHGSYF